MNPCTMDSGSLGKGRLARAPVLLGAVLAPAAAVQIVSQLLTVHGDAVVHFNALVELRSCRVTAHSELGL